MTAAATRLPPARDADVAMTVDASEHERYERARFGSSLPRGRRPGVLVVDLSRGFTDPSSPLGSDLDDVVASTRRLLDVARERALPVLFTTIGYEPNLKDGGLWPVKAPATAALVVGGEWVEIDPRLGPRLDETVVVKKGASALFGTNVLAILLAQGVDTVVVCGATTSGCVRATAVDLMQNGLPALVVRECVGDRFAQSHETALFDMHAKYADVVELDDVLSYLRRAGEDGSAGRAERQSAPPAIRDYGS